MAKLGIKALSDALLNVGVSEDPVGSNRGKYIDIYNNSVGNPLGSSWCAAFVYYRLQQAAIELGMTNPFIKTGYVQNIYNWAERTGRISNVPQPGMVFIEWIPAEGRWGHTGFVISSVGNSLKEISGNSNSSGSANGYEVCINTRTIVNENFKFINVEP